MNYQVVTQKLKNLNWGWDNWRVAAYIAELSLIRGRRYSPSTLPPKHYGKLMNYLEIYERVNHILVSSGGSWQDAEIVDFLDKHSTDNRLKFGD